jgi:hypothetical protein
VLAQRSLTAGIPLRIEQLDDNLVLDQQRREKVLALLASNSIHLPPELVVLTRDVRSLSGPEAVIQYQNLLNQTMAGPTSASAGAGASGAAVGGLNLGGMVPLAP